MDVHFGMANAQCGLRAALAKRRLTGGNRSGVCSGAKLNPTDNVLLRVSDRADLQLVRSGPKVCAEPASPCSCALHFRRGMPWS